MAELFLGGGTTYSPSARYQASIPIAGEAADRLDALLARFAEVDRGSVTEVVREVLEIAPERVHEATVATARAAADDVLLDDRDVSIPGSSPSDGAPSTSP